MEKIEINKNELIKMKNAIVDLISSVEYPIAEYNVRTCRRCDAGRESVKYIKDLLNEGSKQNEASE